MPLPRLQDIHRDTITLPQIKQLYDHAKTNYTTQEYLILLMIRDLDCRPHEITKAQWSWIKEDKIYFHDCKTGDTQGFLSQELQETIQHHKTETKIIDNKYIFVNQKGCYKGQKISDNGWTVRQLVKKLTQQQLGRTLTPQDIRASIITEEYNSYVNPKIIQRKARHRNQKTTLKYNHISDKQLKEYIQFGTIFMPNQINKGSYIKTLPQDINEGEDGNWNFSFSIIFYQTIFGECGISLEDKDWDGINHWLIENYYK